MDEWTISTSLTLDVSLFMIVYLQVICSSFCNLDHNIETLVWKAGRSRSKKYDKRLIYQQRPQRLQHLQLFMSPFFRFRRHGHCSHARRHTNIILSVQYQFSISSVFSSQLT